MACVKVIFHLVNALFCLTVLSLTACGIWYSIQLKDLTDLRNYERMQLDNTIYWPQVIPWVFCAVGIFAVLANCCGFFSAKNRGMLVVYCVFLLLSIIMLLGVGFAGAWMTKDKNKEFIEKTVWEVFTEAQDRPLVAQKFRQLETEMHCCGAASYKNYLNLRKPIPESCCNPTDMVCRNTSKYNARHGCIEVVTYYSNWAFVYGTSACGFAAFLGLISLLLSVVIYIGMKDSSKVIS